MEIKNIVCLEKPNTEVDKRIKYLMTKGKEIMPIKNLADGEKITITHICDFTDTDKDGNETFIQTYMTDDGRVFCTQSQTFIEDIDDIGAIFDGENFSVVKKTGTSKAGREFVYAVLAE